MSERTEIVQLDQPTFALTKRSFFAAAFSSPSALVAYAAPVAGVSILALILMVAVAPAGHLVFANWYPQFVHLPTTPAVVLLVIVVSLSLLAHTIGASAATVITTSRALHREVGVVQALRHSVRRLRSTLPAAVLVFALLAAAVLIAVSTTLLGAPVLLAAIVLAVELIVIHPALYLVSLAALRPGPVTWRDMRDVARAVNERGLFARVPLGATLAAGVGVAAVLVVIQRVTVTGQLATMLFGSGILLAFVVTIVGTISVISRLTIAGLTYRDSPESIELPAVQPAAPRRAAAGWLVAVLAIVLPFAFLAGSIVVNPTGIPVTVTAEIGNTDDGLQSVDAGSGVVINVSQEFGRERIAVCHDAICERATGLSWGGLATAIAPDPAGGIITAYWTADDAVDEQQLWTLTLAAFSASEVQEAAQLPERDRDNVRLDPERVTELDTVSSSYSFDAIAAQIQAGTDVVINTSGANPVIASLNELATEGEQALTVYRCDDRLCATKTSSSVAITSDNLSSSYETLDLALGDDGTAFVTVSGYRETAEEYEEDDTALVVVPLAGEPTVTRIIDGPHSGFGFDADNWGGSRVVVTSEGFATVLYRLRDTGALHLLTCANTDCTESTTQEVPGLNSVDFLPAIAVDGTGRPLIATYNAQGSAVTVLSCTDAACSSFETKVVASALSEVTSVAIDIASDGLPLVTISNSHEVDRRNSLDESALIVLCQQPRCGAK